MARVTSPRLVGRREERARLLDALRRARDAGPHVVLLAGEAGIGKTRLVVELGRLAREEGASVLVGGCPAIGADALPNAPLSAVLRALAAELGPAELSDVLGPARDDLARLVPRLAPDAGGAGEPPSPARLYELVLGVVERLAERAPLVLAVEDLHWADESTRALLAFLATSLAPAPVLIVATYRSDELHRRHALLPLLAELERRGPPQRLELQALSRGEIAELAEAITGAMPDTGELDRIEQLTQGNPFYVEEVLAAPRPLRASGDLAQVVHARLGRLRERDLRLLRLAAAAEATVELDTLVLVAEEDRRRLEDAVRRLVERHVLVRREAGLELRHALVQEVLYDELLPGEREHVHARYARALETARPERVGEIAYHWWRAGDPVRALPTAIEAGRSAELAGALPEAYRCYDRALAIWEGFPGAEAAAGMDHARLVLHAAHSALTLRRLDQAAKLVEGELRRGDVDPLVEAKLWQALATAHWLRWEPSVGDLERSLERVRAAGPFDGGTRGVEAARLLADAAFGFAVGGRPTRAAAILDDALAAAHATGDSELEARIVNVEATILVCRQDERAVERLQLALERARRSGSASAVSRTYDSLSWALLQLGRFDEALATAAEAIATMRRLGTYTGHGVFTQTARIETLYRLGRWDEAVSQAETLTGLDEPPRHPVVPPVLFVRRGADGAFAARLRRDHANARRFGEEPWVLAATGLALVELAASERRFDEARETADAALALLLPGSVLDAAELAASAVGAEAERASLARARQDRVEPCRCVEEAERIVARVEAAAAGPGMCRSARLGAFLAVADAELARTAGSVTADPWESLAAEWTRIGEAYPAAYAAFRAAEALLVNSGGWERAARDRAACLLVRAHDAARSLGATPLLAEVEGLARRARLALEPPERLTPAPAPVGDLGLTPREVDVLHLLAEGRSNGEIGRALFVTTKTASTHVSHILVKLGAANRIEAAAIAHRLGLVTPAQGPPV
jgi:DNA-binding CsgD family transcriptional regulator/tetratricopeptide (TPR) repeat protein